MAQLIRADGTVKEVQPANGKSFTLKELQKFVGGYIEIVMTRDHRTMVINEEGKLNDLPFNEQATMLYQYGMFDPIVGDVLVCNKNEVK